MPMIVGILFIIALLVVIAGLFLSPGPHSSRLRKNYLVTSKGRRIVEAIPTETRARRTTGDGGIQSGPVKRRASARTDYLRTESGITARTTTSKAMVSSAYTEAISVGPRAAGPVSGLGLLYADPLDFLQNRLGPWKIAIPGLIMIFLLFFYLLNMALPHSPLWSMVSFGTANPPTSSTSSSPVTYTASQHLTRLGQLDPAQYQSRQEFDTWAYSACSAASMTEVLNAYGHTYRITDILKIESAIHAISPDLGLLEEVGIKNTGARFGFKTTWGHNLSLDQVIAAARNGTPVIVSFPPERYADGHILVVRGGDSHVVDLADSSRLNWTQLSRERFLQLWGGFYAIMTPV